MLHKVHSKMKTRYRYSVLLVLFIVLTISCRRDEGIIPFVPVNFAINLNNPAYVDLNPIPSWLYVSGGSKGILIYRSSQDQFMTYDRHSPYEVDEGCICAVDSSNLIIEDPCSGSRFLITDGSILEGPATRPLQQYNNSFDGTSILSIYN